MTNYIDQLLANPANRIAIASGEGGHGSTEMFSGRRTQLAIKRRLTTERCNGDRFAYAVIETNDPTMCGGYAITWSGNDGDYGQTTFPGIATK